MGTRASALTLLLLAGQLASQRASAQEIEPRAYSPSPIGVTFVLAGVSRSEGGILTDPSLPVDDVEATIDAGVAGVGHTFSLFGRSASAAIAVPYIWGDFNGTLFGEPASTSRSGLGDTRLRLGMNLLGGPALTPQEFARRKPAPTLGASVVVAAPTGQYDGERLVNIGTNRWAIKPEVGVSFPVGKWFLEGYAGVWMFEDNPDFFGGQRREQDPLPSVQAHFAYQFRPRLWVAFDAVYYWGGESTIDGVPRDDRQSNSRGGVTFSVPVGQSQSLKFNWSNGASTRIGSSFMTYGISWQYTFIE
jgi:hypothetical protein